MDIPDLDKITYNLGNPSSPDSDSLSPILGLNFIIHIMEIGTLKCKSITLPSTKITTLKYKEGHQRLDYSNALLDVEYGDLIIEKMTTNKDLEDKLLSWYDLVLKKGLTYYLNIKNAVVQVLDGSNNVVRAYNLYGIFPVSIEYSPLEATSNNIHMQKVVFKINKMEIDNGI